MDLCQAGNVSAVLSINEKDDGAAFVEYLWGDNTTTYGALRHRDGHPQPFREPRCVCGVVRPLGSFLTFILVHDRD